MEQVQTHLGKLAAAEPDRHTGYEQELRQLDTNISGWSQSLANPSLAVELRVAIESLWKEALVRKRAIEQHLREYAVRRTQADELLCSDDVLARLDKLADVLAGNNPTLGNFELSFHIDRIVCHPDGRVQMRTCQLGALSGAAELLHQADVDPLDSQQAPTSSKTDGRGPRRRTRLCLHDADGERSQLQAQADYVADPLRFAGLGDEWFWIDELRIPVKTSWAVDNADVVQRRYNEIKQQTGKEPSLNVLVSEFGKSRPTITAALKVAENGGPIRDPRRKDPGSPTVDAKALAEEFARLEREGLQRAVIAKRHGVHRNTVARVLKEWYGRQGIEPVDGRTTRWSKQGE
ncbi:MAG: hypothetical protein C0485_17585 [Pirellula sp.]|nr:hypothetical protein [Pirellula sp.]